MVVLEEVLAIPDLSVEAEFEAVEAFSNVPPRLRPKRPRTPVNFTTGGLQW